MGRSRSVKPTFSRPDLGSKKRGLIYCTWGDTGKFPTLHLPQHSGWTWGKVILEGDLLTWILELEAEWAPDLVVLATRGRLDFLDALRGSTTERVVRGVYCPVLAVPFPR